MTKTSKQKKTNEEKQAKKKELDRAALWGGALEAGLECSGERGGGTWKLQWFKLFSILLTSALRIHLFDSTNSGYNMKTSGDIKKCLPYNILKNERKTPFLCQIKV